MIRILLVSSNMYIINNISGLLKKHDIQITKSELGMKALTVIKKEIFDLVIIDEVLNDMSGLELAENMVSTNPLINCAAISGLSPNKFHAASEGLGLLMQLPLFSNEIHIENLLSHLKKVLNITSIKKDGGL